MLHAIEHPVLKYLEKKYSCKISLKRLIKYDTM